MVVKMLISVFLKVSCNYNLGKGHFFFQLFDYFFCISIEFCPVYCDSEKEQHCSGDWDPKTGEQITADTCIPKYDADGCWNQCQTTCPADADGQWCTKQDTNGCESGWCDSGSELPFLWLSN